MKVNYKGKLHISSERGRVGGLFSLARVARLKGERVARLAPFVRGAMPDSSEVVSGLLFLAGSPGQDSGATVTGAAAVALGVAPVMTG